MKQEGIDLGIIAQAVRQAQEYLQPLGSDVRLDLETYSKLPHITLYHIHARPTSIAVYAGQDAKPRLLLAGGKPIILEDDVGATVAGAFAETAIMHIPELRAAFYNALSTHREIADIMIPVYGNTCHDPFWKRDMWDVKRDEELLILQPLPPITFGDDKGNRVIVPHPRIDILEAEYTVTAPGSAISQTGRIDPVLLARIKELPTTVISGRLKSK